MERRKGLRRDGDGARRFAAKRSRITQRSAKQDDDRARQADVREIVFARDGHRCVLDRFQGHTWSDPAPVSDAADDLDADVEYRVPRCSGRLTFGHRRKASAGGAYVAANGWATCVSHQGWIEDQPDAARSLGGETPWWLVLREGDPEWTSLGRKANVGVR